MGESFCKDGDSAAGVDGGRGVPWFEAPFVTASRFWVAVSGEGVAEASSATTVTPTAAFFFLPRVDFVVEIGGGAPGTIRCGGVADILDDDDRWC